LFRERLTQAGAIESLFNRFDATLKNAGYLPMSGQILDATLVAAPKQRNTNTGKVDLWAERIPEDWQDKPVKLSHKDRHARWTLKVTKANGRMTERYPPQISLSRSLDTNPTSPSTESFGSSANGKRRTPPPVMTRD